MQLIDSLLVLNFIYVPFLFLLYLSEVWIILKPGSSFRGSFYTLFVATAVADLIMSLDTFHELRFPLFPLVNGMYANYDCGACASARVTISYICPFAQDLMNTFVALNRLTSIMFPVHHARIWKILLPISICFSYILAIAIFSVTCTRKIFYPAIPLPDYTVYFAKIDTSYLPWYNTVFISIVEMGITSILIISFYAIAGRGLRKLVGSPETLRRERMLINLGLINFTIIIPATFFQFLMHFEFIPFEWMINALYLFGPLIDMKCYSAAVSLILVNKSFRAKLIGLLGFKRPKEGITVSVSGYQGSVSPRTDRRTMTVARIL